MRRLFVVLVVLAGCVPRPNHSAESQPPASAAASDTMYGRVESIGADPDTWLALVLDGGSQRRLSGAVARELGAVTGAEVWVSGARQSDGFRVDRYQVRRVNGESVDDGTVVVAAESVQIETSPGVARSIPNAPPALRQLNGARIWVSRPVAGVAPSYGVIVPAK